MVFANPKKLRMVAGSFYIPKDNPAKPCGDDAHFFCEEAQVIGVADGVGKWATKGIDAGEYARELMRNAADFVKPCNATVVDPMCVLTQAFANTAAQGSTTACIITLTGERLMAANVGDSGFLVIRNGNVVYQSPKQQRRFNCPYQLGNTKDNPSVADQIEVAVEAGDIVVAGTDGLLDNMHVSEIVEIVSNQSMREEKEGLMEQAYNMANVALYNSSSKYIDTPSSIAARNARRRRHRRGGKPDDITVIIARVEVIDELEELCT